MGLAKSYNHYILLFLVDTYQHSNFQSTSVKKEIVQSRR
jgi:hypothetical protein